MGFFSSAFDYVSRKVSNAVSYVKEKAGKVVGWMAEKAESFVGNVKKVWGAVKPYVAHIQAALTAAAEATSGIPWLSAAITGVNAGITALTTFSNSPIAKKIDQAIQFSIKLAKRWQENKGMAVSEMAEEELKEARQHQETFRMAERESADESERHKLELMAAINDFNIAKADLSKELAGEPVDFEHYLRLRATQKLLVMSNKRFQAATSIDDLGADDLFLVRIASDLVKSNPELNEIAADRLDRILSEKYGKKLASFVYEELIASWKKESAALSRELDKENGLLAKDVVLLRRLRADKKIQNEISSDDAALLERLEVDVPKQEKAVAAIHREQSDVDCYANAAEGFLQLLEKTEKQLEEEDRAYVLEEGEEVGKIILDVAENKTPFSDLPGEDQALLRDFANAFRADAESRMKTILEVTA